MIKSWLLQQFKSAYDKTTLEFAPLTIFTGANSSGKSTVIQSLLLTAQTLQSPVASRAVVLNGHIVKLGTFNDIVSNNAGSKEVLIGFELQPVDTVQGLPVPSLQRAYYTRHNSNLSRKVKFINCYFTFSASGEDKEIRQLHPRVEECNVKVEQVLNERFNDEVHVRRSSKSIQERLSQYGLSDEYPEASSLSYEVVKPLSIRRMKRYYGIPTTGRPVGCSSLHFLPEKISIVYDAVEEQARQFINSLVTPEEFRFRGLEIGIEDSLAVNDKVKAVLLSILENLSNYIGERGIISEGAVTDMAPAQLQDVIDVLSTDFSVENLRRIPDLSPTLRQLIVTRITERTEELVKAARAGLPPEYSLAYVPLPDYLEFGVNYTIQFFNQLVKYLGPLRDEPKPVYPLTGATDTKDVGFRGEHTASVLEIHRQTRVKYIPSAQIARGISVTNPVTTTLSEAVLDWLNYMGVASNVKTVDKGKLGHELKVATTGEDSLYDLTHVGVGVSQVLPILVLSLLADRGATLIFEQPELHLHPRVQTRLADFFVSMTALGKQCIVETHSEYLINRLRYQAVISEGEQISSQVIMYFVEKQQGRSHYRHIRINKYGVIEDWPKGFFDENEETAASILKAAMGKRKRRHEE